MSQRPSNTKNKKTTHKRHANSHPRRRSTKRTKSHDSTNKVANNPTQKIHGEFTFHIDNLLHDGRGVGIYTGEQQTENTEEIVALTNQPHPPEKYGKKVFISFALPNEMVKVTVSKVGKSFEEADCTAVVANHNPQRQTPICQHFGKCGGCSLQHWQADGQIEFKQSVLAELLEHQSGKRENSEKISPDNWLNPIIGEQSGYRTKARIGVKYLTTENKLIFGFRERASNRLVEIDECSIMDVRVGSQLTHIKTMIESLDRPEIISHLEIAIGENMSESISGEMKDLTDGNRPIAIIIRHLKPFNQNDMNTLKAFFGTRNWQLYVQGSKEQKSIKRVQTSSEDTKHNKKIGRLFYQLPDFNLIYEFAPTDFTQVNMSVNRQMVKLACELLNLKTGERVLDLFSGLGNFSLAMARHVGGKDGSQGLVIGVEGSHQMTQRANDNAKRNALTNTQFFTHDLTQDLSQTEWANGKENGEAGGFDALLIDPPRSGAWEIMQYIPKFNAQRIVYVSCNPATLARDSQALIQAGYRMTDAGVMDMFCHTGHVESIARFELNLDLKET